MFDNRRWITSRGFLTVMVLLLVPVVAKSQEAKSAPPSDNSASSAELMGEVRALAGTVRDLQAQVQSLNSQLSELRSKDQVSEQSKDQAGSQTGTQSASMGRQIPVSSKVVQNSVPADPYSVFPAGGQNASGSSTSNTALALASTDQSIEGRVAKLEDDQQLIDEKLTDQYQTKVESGSKYRVRLSGMVLLNLFENRGTFDNADFPEIVTEPNPFDSQSTFGGTLRQSQIKIQVFGPQIWGAHTTADINFDFAGGFPDAPNGTVLNLPRLRTGTIRLDWENTSLVAGQDFLFFSPLQPTSLASVAVPPLSYSGNLWGWTPQVRIEHRINFSETSHLLLEGGILDSLTGDLPESEYDRYPSWGEQSGQPAYAGRVAWSRRIFGQNMTFGEGAYYGRQYWSLSRNINGWAATSDVTIPLGQLFTFTGAFYRGAGVGGLGGAIGQDIVISGNYAIPSTMIKGIDSMGGWAQLKYKPKANFEINGAFGQDNPFANQIRMYAATTPPVYGSDLLVRNQSAFVNFIYQPRSNVMVSVEYLRMRTFDLDSSYSANHMNMALGYIF